MQRYSSRAPEYKYRPGDVYMSPLKVQVAHAADLRPDQTYNGHTKPSSS